LGHGNPCELKGQAIPIIPWDDECPLKSMISEWVDRLNLMATLGPDK